MEQKQINRGIDTMSVMHQARALRGMHQRMVLGSLVDAIASAVRGALGGAGRAVTLAYGRTHR